ncbi:MAG TPA: hypothetical protein DEQ61_09775 [Streptomyces sp.]|nr:hypothetical protein [Streptomyces sp.]
MHAYLITAKPGRWQRSARAVRVWTVRLLVAALLIALGAVVLALRCARPLIDLAATAAIRTELEVSIRTGLPGLGALAGARLAEAFAHEFRTAWKQERTDTP